MGYGFSGNLGSSKATNPMAEAESKVNSALNKRGKRRKYFRQIRTALDFIRSNYGNDSKRCLAPIKEEPSFESGDEERKLKSGLRMETELNILPPF